MKYERYIAYKGGTNGNKANYKNYKNRNANKKPDSLAAAAYRNKKGHMLTI